tara:strand:+ start:109 stop:543 length:435 start_codon:yes stop_codon:yes gene_type:complete
MTIETKYEYKYYTVINIEHWRRGNEEWFGEDGFTWENAINFIDHKFKISEDTSVNKYRVEYAQYCNDIEYWISQQERHKERPVFVQFREDQEIKTKGEGSLFVLYRDEGIHYSSASDDDTQYNSDVHGIAPDDDYTLASAGGRL